MITIIREKIFFKLKEVWFTKPENDRKFDVVHVISYKDYDNPEFIKTINKTSIIDLKLKENDLLKLMNKTTRYEIKKTESRNVDTRLNENWEEFYSLYRNFQKNKKLKVELLESLEKNSVLFNLYFEGNLTNTILFYDSFPIARARKIVSLKKVKNSSYLSRYLLWRSIQYFKSKNYSILDLGGLDFDDKRFEGINKFKLGFGGKIINQYDYFKYNNTLLYLLFFIKNLKKNLKLADIK
jgi:lipid II:glycine glycyltransferase (peptidoglycan interpeptide bridge formation enzyme)